MLVHGSRGEGGGKGEDLGGREEADGVLIQAESKSFNYKLCNIIRKRSYNQNDNDQSIINNYHCSHGRK